MAGGMAPFMGRKDGEGMDVSSKQSQNKKNWTFTIDSACRSGRLGNKQLNLRRPSRAGIYVAKHHFLTASPALHDTGRAHAWRTTHRANTVLGRGSNRSVRQDAMRGDNGRGGGVAIQAKHAVS